MKREYPCLDCFPSEDTEALDHVYKAILDAAIDHMRGHNRPKQGGYIGKLEAERLQAIWDACSALEGAKGKFRYML